MNKILFFSNILLIFKLDWSNANIASKAQSEMQKNQFEMSVSNNVLKLLIA